MIQIDRFRTVPDSFKYIYEVKSPYDDRYFHSIFYKPVIKELEKKSWDDIDFHKEKMMNTLCKIKRIRWVVVDEDKYKRVFFPEKINVRSPPGLTMSRYGHTTIGEACYPNSKECTECFKYHCGACGEGTNSLYGSNCSSRRCADTINNMSFLQNSIVIPKRVYVFGYSK
jgi:hypothetical protein